MLLYNQDKRKQSIKQAGGKQNGKFNEDGRKNS